MSAGDRAPDYLCLDDVVRHEFEEWERKRRLDMLTLSIEEFLTTRQSGADDGRQWRAMLSKTIQTRFDHLDESHRELKMEVTRLGSALQQLSNLCEESPQKSTQYRL